MQEVQLYISGEKVDLFKDETISLNDSIQNVRDISKIFTAFTKQFNLPASRTNNKIFKHFYNYDITAGFDARFKVDALIKLNGADFKKGKLKLNGVELKDNVAYFYKVVFFGETVTLSETMGDDNLKVLNYLEKYDHRQQYQRNGFLSGIGVAGATSATDRQVVYPFLSINTEYFYDGLDTSSNDNIYHASTADLLPDLKPAIKMVEVIDAIEEKYDLTFSTDFFGSDVFSELYLWCHATKSPIDINFVGKKAKLSDYTYDSGASSVADLLPMRTESNIYYTASFIFSSSSVAAYTFILRDRNSGVIYFQETDIIGNITTGSIVIETSTPQDIDLQIEVRAPSTVTFTSVQVKAQKYTDGVSGGLAVYNHSVINFMRDFIFIQDHLPKMKVIDLLTTIFKMFNLTAYVENDVIIVKTLDDYYTAGTDKDITKYIDVTKTTVNHLSEYSTINFHYSESKTKKSLEFLGEIGTSFGDFNYNVSDKFEGKQYSQKLNIEHVLLENLINLTGTKLKTGVVYGRFADAENKPVLGKPYLFFNRVNDVTSYPIISNGTEDTYNAPANVSADGNHTINFGHEYDEYTGSTNTSSLFSRFYEQYLVNSFSQKSRLSTVTAYLPLSFLLNYNLNDTIIISGKKYLINNIKINLQTGKTNIELIVKVNDFTASVLT